MYKSHVLAFWKLYFDRSAADREQRWGLLAAWPRHGASGADSQLLTSLLPSPARPFLSPRGRLASGTPCGQRPVLPTCGAHCPGVAQRGPLKFISSQGGMWTWGSGFTWAQLTSSEVQWKCLRCPSLLQGCVLQNFMSIKSYFREPYFRKLYLPTDLHVSSGHPRSMTEVGDEACQTPS